MRPAVKVGTGTYRAVHNYEDRVIVIERAYKDALGATCWQELGRVTASLKETELNTGLYHILSHATNEEHV